MKGTTTDKSAKNVAVNINYISHSRSRVTFSEDFHLFMQLVCARHFDSRVAHLDLFILIFNICKHVRVSEIFRLTAGMCILSSLQKYFQRAYARVGRTMYLRSRYFNDSRCRRSIVWAKEKSIWETRNFFKETKGLRNCGAAFCFQRLRRALGTRRERCASGRIVFTSCKQTGSCLIILASAR